MRHPGGYATFTSEDGVREMDTFTCAHCQKIVHVKPKASPDELGGFCRNCMKPVCPSCASKGCTPFEKRLEAWEAKDRARRSYAEAWKS
jgi:hypothetical protein